VSGRLTTFVFCAALAAPAASAASLPEGLLTGFAQAAARLPCAADVTKVIGRNGYVPSGATGTPEEDYADLDFTNAATGALLTLARERTPRGPQYALSLEFPASDNLSAESLIAALREALGLPAPVGWQNLTSGSAFSWNTTLGGHGAQIILRLDGPNIRVMGLLDPIKPGTPVTC